MTDFNYRLSLKNKLQKYILYGYKRIGPPCFGIFNDPNLYKIDQNYNNKKIIKRSIISDNSSRSSREPVQSGPVNVHVRRKKVFFSYYFTIQIYA